MREEWLFRVAYSSFTTMDTPLLLFKVEEVLLLVPCHHSDVVDAGLLKLADLTLDQNLSTNMQQTFGLLVGNRGERDDRPAAKMIAFVHLKRGERHRTRRRTVRRRRQALCRPALCRPRSPNPNDMALRAAIARWLVPGSRSSAASTANSFFVIKTEHPFMADFRRSRSCVEVHFLLYFKEYERYVHLYFSTTKYETHRKRAPRSRRARRILQEMPVAAESITQKLVYNVHDFRAIGLVSRPGTGKLVDRGCRAALPAQKTESRVDTRLIERCR